MAEVTNDDRAEWVAPMVQEFHDAHYFHPAGEPLATVVQDIFTDLMHFVDRLPMSEFEGRKRVSPRALMLRAIEHYTHELAEELADEELEDGDDPLRD